jgi:hypothetical protein
MPHKTAYQLGMETVLNNPQTSFLTNPSVFREIHKQSGMSLNGMMRHIGSQVKGRKAKPPTDAERSEARLETMEEKNKKTSV